MASHSSTLAWKIPWTGEPGRLQSMGLWTVKHDWATSLSLFTFMHWRRKWQPTPVFLPGESPGRGSWWAAVYGVSQSQTRLKQLSSSSSEHIEIYILHTHHFYTIQVYGRPLSFRLDKLGKNFLMLISFLTHLSLSIRDSNKKRDPLWV